MIICRYSDVTIPTTVSSESMGGVMLKLRLLLLLLLMLVLLSLPVGHSISRSSRCS